MKHSLDSISICVEESGHATQLSIIVSLHVLMGQKHPIWFTVVRSSSGPHTHLALSSVQMYYEIPAVVPDLSILFFLSCVG